MLLVASALGGHLNDGLLMFGVMTAFGVAILLSGHSETIRGLRGDGRDERFMQMDLKATACAELVVILAVIGGFVHEIAQGAMARRTRGSAQSRASRTWWRLCCSAGAVETCGPPRAVLGR